MRILIVDDEKDIVYVLQSILKKYGDCDTAKDGQEAVTKVVKSIQENSLYDVIFLDISMPNLNGQETLKIIRTTEEEQKIQFSQQAKIVMTTAFGDKDNVLSAFREQCEGYVVKPFEPKDIKNMLQKLELIPN